MERLKVVRHTVVEGTTKTKVVEPVVKTYLGGVLTEEVAQLSRPIVAHEDQAIVEPLSSYEEIEDEIPQVS